MDKPHFPSDSPFLTDADDRREPLRLWSYADSDHYEKEAEEMRDRQRRADIAAQVAEYEELGDMPSVPRDFWPQPTAPMQLVDDEPEAWRGWIGPVLLFVALLGAVVSCVFGG